MQNQINELIKKAVKRLIENTISEKKIESIIKKHII